MQTVPVTSHHAPSGNLSGVLRIVRNARDLLVYLQPAALLLARFYVAQVFFLSGLTKIRDWSTTVALFTDEYHVPILSPQIAAAMGATGELTLPVLLALGLGGRFAALGLFFMNIVAVISYTDITPAGIQQHYLWGALLAMIVLWGPGRISLDNTWLKRFWN
jgi:putative oxidoreductase